MGRSKQRGGPSSPAEIMAAAAERRGDREFAERQSRKDPATWGVAEMLHLPTAANVNVVLGDNHDKVIAANRSDGFDLMHAAKGLTDDQHRASRRLFRAWCLRAGVRDRARPGLDVGKVDGGRRDPSSRVTDAMIQAGREIAFCLKFVGPVSAKVLEGQISPLVDEGRIIVWRVHVELATGEKNKDVQGGLLRTACENLRLAYEAWDDHCRDAADRLKLAAA